MLFNRLRDRRQSPENPATSLANPAPWLFDVLGGGRSPAGVSVDERSAFKLSAIWAAIGIIADMIGQVPLGLFERDGDDRHPRPDHRLDALVNFPNTEMTSISWRSTKQAHVLSWGGGYSWIRRSRSGDPIELIPLLPDRTTLRRLAGELFFESRVQTTKGAQTFRIAPADVVHVPGLGFDGLTGYSPIRMQRDQLAASIAAQNFSARFFGNGATVSGLVTVQGKIPDKKKFRDEWDETFGGENQLKTAVMDQAADYKRIGIPPEDAQFIETQNFGVEQCARMYRVPLQFLARMGDATYNNSEQMGIFFASYTLAPWVTRWEQELNRKLLTDAERKRFFFKFNLNGILRGAQKDRYDAYHQAITDGWMVRNEARRKEDLNAIDGLDEPLQPMNMQIVGLQTANIVRSAVDQLVRKESNEVVRSRSKCATDSGFRRRIEQFYAKHVDTMCEGLGVSRSFAVQYCQAHQKQALEAEQLQGVVEDWRTTHAKELTDIILIGDSNG